METERFEDRKGLKVQGLKEGADLIGTFLTVNFEPDNLSNYKQRSKVKGALFLGRFWWG
jgi:hypothetical protein